MRILRVHGWSTAPVSSKFSPPKLTSANPKELAMKTCNECGEDFRDAYAFCPVDGMPLISLLPLGEGPGMRGCEQLIF
jgi:hypothetical protein